MERKNCAPDMCIMPCLRELDEPRRWSDTTGVTWRTFRAASIPMQSEAGGTISPLSLDASLVAWQLSEALSVAPTDEYLTMEIPAGFNMVLDAQPPRFEKLVVGCKAKLQFDHSLLAGGAVLSLEADNILVYGDLIIGTPEQPWPSDIIARIVLHGHRSLTKTLVVDESNDLGNKVLAVFGNLEMHGPVPAVAWTSLASTAAANSNELVLEEAVDWNVGDTVIVSSTDMPIYRSGMPSETGGTDPRYVLEEVDGRHDETATITQVSNGGKTLTLDTSLHQSHFAGTVDYGAGTVKIAAHVGLLTRNIQVKGELEYIDGEGMDWYKGYGGHVVVGQADFPDAGDTASSVKIGSMTAVGVQFDDVGKHNSEHAAIFFYYRTVFDEASAPTNIIDGCSINSWNPAVVSFGSYGLSITKTVVARTYGVGIDIDRDSFGTIVEDVLMVGNYRSPTDEFSHTVCAFDRSCRFLPFAAFHFWNYNMASVKRNVIAGSEDTGIMAPAVDACDPNVAAVYEDNEVYGALIGYHLTPKKGGCAELRSVKAWKNAHMGIHQTDGGSDIQLRNVQVLDNHLGIVLNFVKNGDKNEVRIIDSVIVGDTEASSCSDPTCQAVSQGDTTGRSCGSSFGKSWRHVGLVIPQYNNLGKTCGSAQLGIPSAGTISVCRRPLMLFRQCQNPLDNRFGNMGVGLPGMYHADLHLENVGFANFHTNDCNLRSRAVAHHAEVPDMTPTMHFSGISWHDVDPDAKVQLGDVDYMTMVATACRDFCDAIMHMVLHDGDGSTMGAPGTMVAERQSFNPEDDVIQGIVDNPECVHAPDTMSINCPAIPFVRTTFEAVDQDRSKRRIGPVKVYKYGAHGRNSTMFSEGVFPQGCSCQKHFSQFHFQLEAGFHYDLETRGSIPGNTRLRFPSEDPNDAMLFRIFFTQPMEINVFVDGKKVPANEEGVKPTIEDVAGTNMLHPQERWLYLTVRGGSTEYQLVVGDVIQVTTSLKMTREEFFADALEDVMVSNFATLLGIPASRIKVVCVHYIGQPCLGRRRDRRDVGEGEADDGEEAIDCTVVDCGELQVKVEISAVNNVNADDAEVSPESLQANFEEMEELMTKVNEIVVESNQLQQALATEGIEMNEEVVFMPPRSVGADMYQVAEESGGFKVSPVTPLGIIDVITPVVSSTAAPVYTPAPDDTLEVTFSLNYSCSSSGDVPTEELSVAAAEAVNDAFINGIQNIDVDYIDYLKMTQVPKTVCTACLNDGRVHATVKVDVPFAMPLYQKLLAGEFVVPLNATGEEVTNLLASAEFGPNVCGYSDDAGEDVGEGEAVAFSGSGSEDDYVNKHSILFYFTALPPSMTEEEGAALMQSVIGLIVDNSDVTRESIERVELHNIELVPGEEEEEGRARKRRATPTAEAIFVAAVTEAYAEAVLNYLYAAGGLSVSHGGGSYAVAALQTGTVIDASTTTTATTSTSVTTTVTSASTRTATATTTTIYDPENVDCVESQDACTAECETSDQRNYQVTVAAVKNGRACVGPTDCEEEDGDCSLLQAQLVATVADSDGLTSGAVAGIAISAVVLVVAIVGAAFMASKNKDAMKVHPTTQDHELFPSGQHDDGDAHHKDHRPTMSDIMPTRVISPLGAGRKNSLPIPGRPSFGNLMAAGMPTLPQIPSKGQLPPLNRESQKFPATAAYDDATTA